MRNFERPAILAARILRREARKAARVRQDSALWAAFVKDVRKLGGMRRVKEDELLRFLQARGWPEPGHAEEWLDGLFASKLRMIGWSPGRLRAAKAGWSIDEVDG
jgi:hypothetical protein